MVGYTCEAFGNRQGAGPCDSLWNEYMGEIAWGQLLLTFTSTSAGVGRD